MLRAIEEVPKKPSTDSISLNYLDRRVEYFVEFYYVPIGVSYEAQLPASIAGDGRPFGNRNSLLDQPVNEFFHTVDDHCPVCVSGPLGGMIHQRVLAFGVGDAVVDKVNSNAGVVDEAYGSVRGRIFVWVDPKTQLRIKRKGSITIENANPDVIQGGDLEHPGGFRCKWLFQSENVPIVFGVVAVEIVHPGFGQEFLDGRCQDQIALVAAPSYQPILNAPRFLKKITSE